MSIFDNSLAALKANLKALQDQGDNLTNKIATIQGLIAPLNVQLSDTVAQQAANTTAITNVNANIADLQKIIDADNTAVANGQTPPSEIFISTYLR